MISWRKNKSVHGAKIKILISFQDATNYWAPHQQDRHNPPSIFYVTIPTPTQECTNCVGLICWCLALCHSTFIWIMFDLIMSFQLVLVDWGCRDCNAQGPARWNINTTIKDTSLTITWMTRYHAYQKLCESLFEAPASAFIFQLPPLSK